MQDYLEAVHRRLCSACEHAIFMNGGEFARCGLPSFRACPVETYLPQAITEIEMIESPWMQDYMIVLKEKICRLCKLSNSYPCDAVQQATCFLDRHFALVGEAIEEVRLSKEKPHEEKE